MIYCENIVDMKPVFYSSRDFETIFFFIFGNAIITIAKKKKIYSPISAMTLPRLPFYFILRALYTRVHSDSGISSIPLPKFNIFSLPILSPAFSFSLFSLLLFILSPAFYSLSCFLVEFRQCHYRNSVSLLIFPIIFEQFV